MNKSDSERLAAQLEKKGHQADSNLKEADLIVINVCSVRQSAVNRVYSKIEQIRLKNPKAKLVLTGCLLAKDKNKLKDQIDEIWPIVGLSIKPRRIIESIQRDEPEYKSAKEALVPIMTGCDNFCSYCVVPYTRGREYSRPAQEIVEEIKNLVNKNYQKIILLGQNVNSYQSELRIKNQESRIDFPKLLKMIDGISGEFKIKFLTSHPKDMSDQLIEAISQSEKISKEIHLPVQSGDDVILKKMNRGYTVKDYQKLVKKIRQALPQAKISTDIIVGFPGETKKQFQNTIKLVKKIGFCQIYAAAYSPRAGTAAFKLKDNVLPLEKKRRKRIILEMLK